MKIVLVNDIGHDDLCVLGTVPVDQEETVLKRYGHDSRHKWTTEVAPFDSSYPPLFDISGKQDSFNAWAKAAMAAERKR